MPVHTGGGNTQKKFCEQSQGTQGRSLSSAEEPGKCHGARKPGCQLQWHSKSHLWLEHRLLDGKFQMGPVMETDVFPLPHINFSMQLAVDSLLLSEGHSGLSGYQKGQFSTESLLVLTTLQFQCHDITSSARQQTDVLPFLWAIWNPIRIVSWSTFKYNCTTQMLLAGSPLQQPVPMSPNPRWCCSTPEAPSQDICYILHPTSTILATRSVSYLHQINPFYRTTQKHKWRKRFQKERTECAVF